MTSFWCFSRQFWIYFTPFSIVSIVDFKQVNVSWVVYLYNLQISIVKHFYVEFQWFFMASNIQNLSSMNKLCEIKENILLHFLISIICKHRRNHLSRSERNVQALRDRWTKRFLKNCHFVNTSCSVNWNVVYI